MSYAGEEEASGGLLSVDMLIIIMVEITVFIAGHET
jgi:hypothetical protein